MELQTQACLSCGTPLTGQYCNQCGDERFTPEKRTVRYFLGNTLVSEVFNLDGRIWRSLRLLIFRPGFLAAEHAQGRRRPYLHPLRMLLITIVVFAVTMTGTNYSLSLPFGDFVVRLNTIPSPMFFSSTIEGALQRSDPYGVVERMLEEKVGASIAAMPTDQSAEFKEILVSLVTPLSFTVVLLVGMLLYLLFNRRMPLFVDHLVFAMNYYSFLLISAMLSGLMFALAGSRLTFPAVLLLLFLFGLWRFVYVTVAVRRFYFVDARPLRAWLTSAGAAFLVWMFNGICITSIQLASGATAVWLLDPATED